MSSALSEYRGKALSWKKFFGIILESILGLVRFGRRPTLDVLIMIDNIQGRFHGIVLVKRVGVAVASVTDSAENEQQPVLGGWS